LRLGRRCSGSIPPDDAGVRVISLSGCLAERGIDTVFVIGVATNLVLERTVRHGTDLGLTVHTVSDCIATANHAVHLGSLANLDLTTAGLPTLQQDFELFR
jgi:biuret amidohydrolase